MKKILFLFLPCMLTSPTSSIASAVDPASLVKVTPTTDAKCIEYYNYKNELYCSTTAKDTEPADPHLKDYEKLKIVFDDRPWRAAWGKQTPDYTMIEYVPNGEQIDAWNELVTSQFFPGLQEKITPLEFAVAFIERLKNNGYKAISTFLEKTPDQVIFEYRIESPTNQIQDEMQMVTKDANGLYVLHYVIKKANMGQPNRDKWFKNLKESSIKK